MKKNVFRVVLLFMVATLAGCYPDGPDYVDEYDIVYTNYNDQYNFSGKLTYAMPDSVVKITGSVIDGEPVEFLNPTYSNLILGQIEANMLSRGYQRVNLIDDPDYVLFPSAIEITNISYYYDYWGYYYGWYYPPYYGGWYYPYPIVTSYTTGTVIMSLIDNQNFNPSDKQEAVWTGLINGVLEGASTDYAGRIRRSIDQAFTQSQYLHP